MKANESLLVANNAVGAIRVSSTRQGTEGDSPEAQKEQIEKFAAGKGFVIKKFFVFMESASKEQQPMQEAIDYCKDPLNGISHFIIKSIDRFTRGGSLPYDLLKSPAGSQPRSQLIRHLRHYRLQPGQYPRTFGRRIQMEHLLPFQEVGNLRSRTVQG